MKPSREVRLTGLGLATPSQVLTNEALIARFDLPVDSEWIRSKTGIESRHWLPDGETTSDLALEAASQALDEAGLHARDLDRIILATISPDHLSPSTATILARKLGARCPAFDVSAACSGFLYALDLGVASIKCGEQRVLLVSAEARSRFINKSDPRSCVLFSDGAGAAILEAGRTPGLLAIHIGAEGRERMGAHLPAGGAKMPATAETVASNLHFLAVDSKREIFDLFVAYTREACKAVLAKAGLTIDAVDLFITHQGNARMVELTLDALGVPPEKAINNIAHHGNTSGATIPIALAEAKQAGRLAPGQLVMLASVGAGYTFGAALIRF